MHICKCVTRCISLLQIVTTVSKKKDKTPKEGEPYKLIRMTGWVSPNQYKKIKAIINPDTGIGNLSEATAVNMGLQLLIEAHYPK